MLQRAFKLWRVEGERVVATQAYLKVRAEVLDRHKRLYLGSTGGTCMLFMLPVASICKHDKAMIRPVQE